VAEVAWKNYIEYHKSPRTRKAGSAFADPGYELSLDWLAARKRIRAAERAQRKQARDPGSSSSTDPPAATRPVPARCRRRTGWRRSRSGRSRRRRVRSRLPRPSLLTSEYGRVIYPCKACVSTAQPLCHWPCSCYPNHALGQTQDWMNEIYPRWAAAHGVMILAPVNWYHVPSVLKLMIDRLVCADGGNADPTTTQGKDPALAKAIELKGWDYPKHPRGPRVCSRRCTETRGRRRMSAMRLSDWLTTLGLGARGRKRRRRPLCRVFRALCDEPLTRSTATPQFSRKSATPR
jgi:hypothetical protein